MGFVILHRVYKISLLQAGAPTRRLDYADDLCQLMCLGASDLRGNGFLRYMGTQLAQVVTLIYWSDREWITHRSKNDSIHICLT